MDARAPRRREWFVPRRRRPDGDAVSVGRSSAMFRLDRAADAGTTPTWSGAVEAAEGGEGQGERERGAGHAQPHQRQGGKRGAKGHQFKYDGYGGQVTL